MSLQWSVCDQELIPDIKEMLIVRQLIHSFFWMDKHSLCRFTLGKCQKGTWPWPFIKCQQPVFYWNSTLNPDDRNRYMLISNIFSPLFLYMVTKTLWILKRVKLYLIEIHASPTISSFFFFFWQFHHNMQSLGRKHQPHATGTLRCTHYYDSCQMF